MNSYLTQNLELEGKTPAGGAGTAGRAGTPTGTPAANSGDAAARDTLTGVAGADQPTLEQVQSSVKDVKVDMYGDVVKAYVVFDFHGKEMSLELDGRLRSENGYLRFVPISGKLGSLPLPQSTLDSAVEKLMNSPENREKLKLPDDVNDIQIVDGHAVISYK